MDEVQCDHYAKHNLYWTDVERNAPYNITHVNNKYNQNRCTILGNTNFKLRA